MVKDEHIRCIDHTDKGYIATNAHNTKQTVHQCSTLHHADCSMTTILITMNNPTKASCKAKTDCSKDSVYVQIGDTIVLMTAIA